MSTHTLVVESAVFGRTPADACPPPVALRLSVESLSVRELIRLAVEAQVERLMEERATTAARTALILARHYLSEPDIEHQAGQGRVRLPTSGSPRGPALPDIDTAVEQAWHGFQEGAFQVAVAGQMYRRLDEQIPLAAATEAVFLRLTPLRGG